MEIKFNNVHNRNVVILQKYIDNDICIIDQDIEFLNIQYQIKHSTDNILDYFIMFADDWLNIMDKTKSLTDIEYLDYTQNNSILDIAKENNVWISQFNSDGTVANPHEDLFTLYDKQMKILNEQ